jgi:hypothetical protein
MSEAQRRPTRIAVIYYSATGNVFRLARALAEGAAQTGAEVRLREVSELFEEMVISQNQLWGKHRSEIKGEPPASLDDLEWADGVAFGTYHWARSSFPSATRSTRYSTAEEIPMGRLTSAGAASEAPMRTHWPLPGRRAGAWPKSQA